MLSSSGPAAAPPPSARDLQVIEGLGALADRYDLLLCDVWGVLHNGEVPFTAAADALAAYRRAGGIVILVSNAPRPGAVVTEQLHGHYRIRQDAFDGILTSGDLTRDIVHRYGARPYHHIGPDRDLGLFEGLEARSTSLAEAGYVVVTGLIDDEIETAADYEHVLREMKARELELICANPDILVERGHRLIACAGALGAAYEALGGSTYTPGKPHRPIYEAALAKGSELAGRPIPRDRVLGVGDAIRTDIVGGHYAGIDTLLVARGIHAAELGAVETVLDHGRASTWLARQDAQPTWVIRELAW